MAPATGSVLSVALGERRIEPQPLGVDPAPGVMRRRRRASLTEYMALLVIRLAAVTVIMFAVGAWPFSVFV